MLNLIRGTAVAFAFFVMSFGLLLFARDNAPSFQQCQGANYETKSDVEKQPKHLSYLTEKFIAPLCTARFLEAHNAVITAIATVLLTFVTGGLVWTGYQQIRTTRAQLRAYITTVPGEGYRQRRGLRFEFRPIILNTGATPAYRVDNVGNVALLSLEEARTFDFTLPPVPQTVTTLGPNQNRFTQAIMPGRLTKAELRQFRRGTHRLFVYGRINYQDAFGRRRYTNYCYVINWWLRGQPPLWNHVIRHNDSN